MVVSGGVLRDQRQQLIKAGLFERGEAARARAAGEDVEPAGVGEAGFLPIGAAGEQAGHVAAGGEAELDVDVGEAQIRIEQQHAAALAGQSLGEADGEPGFADAAFARGDRHQPAQPERGWGGLGHGEGNQTIGRAVADAGFGQQQAGGGGGGDRAAEASRDVELGDDQVGGAAAAEGARDVGGFGGVGAGAEGEGEGRIAGGGEPGQLLLGIDVEGIDPRRIDQHRRSGAAQGKGAGECDGVGRGHQIDPQQAGEGGQLLGCAGAAAVGGDHHRGDPGHHQPGGQPCDGEGFARAGRSCHQQRAVIERQGGKAEMARQGGDQFALRQSLGQRGGDAVPAQMGQGRRGKGRRLAQRGREIILGFERGGDFHPVAHPAGRQDQRIRPKLAANAGHGFGDGGSAEEFEAHKGVLGGRDLRSSLRCEGARNL